MTATVKVEPETDLLASHSQSRAPPLRLRARYWHNRKIQSRTGW